MKQYKSNEELLEYLILKNVKIINREEALQKINKYSYYSIINSYKNNFKDENNNYKSNVTFEEIFSLYEFDKNIKNLFLKYTLEIEIHIKTLLANRISKEYGIESYLEVGNLDENSSLQAREKIIDRINGEIEENYKVHAAIMHYKEKYGFIPPFVLTKILTFGVISSYYGLLKQMDRQSISKEFKISDKLLKQCLKNLVMVRNISAHSDRLYCFRSKYYVSFKEIDKLYKSKTNTTNLYMVVRIMEIFLGDEYKNFIDEFTNELIILKQNLSSIKIKDILNIMGFPMNEMNL